MNELYCIFGPKGNEYFRNIEFILETLGIEKPVKRDGKVFEDDDCSLKEKFEFFKKKNENKNKVKINIDGDENKDSPYEFGEEIADKISEKLKNIVEEDISRYKFKRNEKKALDEVNKIMNDPVTKNMGDKVLEKLKNDSDHDNKNLHNIPESDFASNIFNGISKMNDNKKSQDIPKEVPRNFPLKSDNMKSLERVIDTINRKDKQYFKDPIQVLSTDDLLTQIKIKAIRAKLTLEDEKRMDELLDIAVYSILTLEKMLIEPVGEHTGVENYK